MENLDDEEIINETPANNKQPDQAPSFFNLKKVTNQLEE